MSATDAGARAARRVRGIALGALVVAAAFAASLLALRRAHAPFVWIGALWAAVALLGVGLARGTGWRLALLHAGLVLAVLAGFELHLVRAEARAYAPPRASTPYTEPHPVLGAVGKPNTAARVVREHEGATVFDVAYHLDERGFRVAPPAPAAEGCIVFFGGSFTFGDGVGDREAMPYQVGLRSGGRFRVVNLGVGGAGAQQMLARLEEDPTLEAVGCRPTHVIYTALPHHVYRAAGKPPEYNFGPAYVLRGDGTLTRAGRIEDRRGRSPVEQSRVLSQLLKSRIYRRVFDAPRLDEDDVATFAAIVSASRDRLAAALPGARFDVLLWDDVPNGETALYHEVAAALRAEGLRVHPVADLLPGYREDRSRYQIHATDRHPNARAHAVLAGWIVEALVDAPGPDRPE